MSDSSSQKFSIVPVVIGVVVIGLFIVLLLPALFRSTDQGYHRVLDMSNLRQVNIGIISYATDYNDIWPGVDRDGNPVDPKIESRYSLLMDYLTSDCLISPYDNDEKVPWTSGPVTSDNYSYAMLQLPDSGGRLSLWSMYINENVVWLSGRNTGSNASTHVNSLQTNDPGEWRGPVGWADGHVTHEEDQYVDTRYTVESDTPLNKDDNLFEAANTDDAYMIYTGN